MDIPNYLEKNYSRKLDFPQDFLSPFTCGGMGSLLAFGGEVNTPPLGIAIGLETAILWEDQKVAPRNGE